MHTDYDYDALLAAAAWQGWQVAASAPIGEAVHVAHERDASSFDSRPQMCPIIGVKAPSGEWSLSAAIEGQQLDDAHFVCDDGLQAVPTHFRKLA